MSTDNDRPRGLIVLRDDNGEIADSYMADCACNHAWETHPDTACSGLDSYGCECECPGYEPSTAPELVCDDCGTWTGGGDCHCLMPRQESKT